MATMEIEMGFPEAPERWDDPWGVDSGPVTDGTPHEAADLTSETWWGRIDELRDDVASEWRAFAAALAAPGGGDARKWLGWALYRLAARVNPDVGDRDA